MTDTFTPAAPPAATPDGTGPAAPPATFTRDTWEQILPVMEQGEADRDGWDANPTLYTFARTPHSVHIQGLNPADWTNFFFGIGPEGATGDVAHDIDLYATRAQPLPGFLGVVLIYHTDPDPDTNTADARTLVAVDERGTAYRVHRPHGTGTAPAEVAYLDDDPHLLALNRLADALRGGPAEHEYTFDVKVFFTATVKATSEKKARALIDDLCDIEVSTTVQGVTLGCGEVDGEADLVSVDGDDPA
ncbi:hypothetical protein [Nonomuraea sp. NPDC003214]